VAQARHFDRLDCCRVLTFKYECCTPATAGSAVGALLNCCDLTTMVRLNLLRFNLRSVANCSNQCRLSSASKVLTPLTHRAKFSLAATQHQ